jgi:DNA modification methylase
MSTSEVKAHEVKLVSVKDLKPRKNNRNKHPKEQIDRLIKIIEYQGFRRPIIVSNLSGEIVCGHGRLMAAKKMGIKEVPVIYQDYTSTEQEYADHVADNSLQGWAELDFEGINTDVPDLGPDFDIDLLGIKNFTIDVNDKEEPVKGNLSEVFGVPPFSVLDTKQGYWQNRKRKWLSLGMKSDIGRSVNPNTKIKDLDSEFKTGYNAVAVETSVFDSTLTEMMYRWFSIKEDLIIDPFAGGCVRGIVASNVDRKYIGIDLREEQIQANRDQEHIANQDNIPAWVCGDSLDMPIIIKDTKADLIFSCPPYADLEVYSDDERDISNMPYPQFLSVYRKIIKNCYDVLNDNRFACFVIGEVRSSKGDYYNFVGDTINAFKDAGFKYYNEMILLNQAGTAAMRAARPFKTGRKICKIHQNVLVFYKGDWKKSTDRLGDVYIPELDNGVSTDE